MHVNMHEAKTRLSELVKQAQNGEEVIIANAGKPVARLVAFEPERPKRIPGLLKGKMTIADDFDETPDWLIAAFEGELDEPEAEA